MADDLGEEWWLDENVENEETNAQNKKEPEATEAAKKSKKRRAEEEIEKFKPAEDQEKNDVAPTEKTKKKRRKKKKKEETVEKIIMGREIAEIFCTSYLNYCSGKLTALEMEDLRIDDNIFLTDNTIHTGDLKELTPYLNTVCPRWSRIVAKIDAKESKGSPGVLVVTSAATRATDVIRASVDFRQNGKAIKLFSKHIKFEEQERYLKEHIVHLGVGTPNRIYKLIKSGSLNISRLNTIILDWTWRDAKQRRLCDIPELGNSKVVGFLIEDDLYTLLNEVVLNKTRTRKITLGLF